MQDEVTHLGISQHWVHHTNTEPSNTMSKKGFMNCAWDWQTVQGAHLQYPSFMIYQKLIWYVPLSDTFTLVWHHNNWLWQVALLFYINKEYIYFCIHPSHTFQQPKFAGLLCNQTTNYTDTIWTKQKTQTMLKDSSFRCSLYFASKIIPYLLTHFEVHYLPALRFVL